MDVTVLHDGGVAYAQAALGRRVAYRPGSGGVETSTKALPGRYFAWVGPADKAPGTTARVSFLLDMFGEGDNVQVGARDVSVEPEEGYPLTAALYRSVPLGDLMVRAVQDWSTNSDGSNVTVAQAKALLRPIGRQVSTDPIEKWRRAANAYNAADARGEPTTVAVAREFQYRLDEKGLAKARQLIARIRDKTDLIPPAKRTRS